MSNNEEPSTEPNAAGACASVEAQAIWCCPACKGDLDWGLDIIGCTACQASYPIVVGIPDFRIENDAWIDFSADQDRARKVDALIRSDGLRAGVEDVFLNSRKFTPEKSRKRTAQVFAGIEKCESQIQSWLAPFSTDNTIEIGSGPGQLIAAGARRGIQIAGVDVSLEWLVVSKHMVIENGGRPVLAAGLAEALPVRSAAVKSLVGLDVVEHVGDQPAFAREISRILAPGGIFALSTPNRFSLSPEPHVGVWGVGYLPRPLQASWVKLASGQGYAYTSLMSRTEALRLFASDSTLKTFVVFPQIDLEEISLFTPFKARLATLYNRLLDLPGMQLILPMFGAYYRVLGSKAQSSASSDSRLGVAG